MNARRIALASLAALAGCGGVSYHVAKDVPAPQSIAVLPLPGDAAPGVRAAARSLLHSRLHARGYLTPELTWVDHVLAGRGWLTDPDHFDAAHVPPAQLAEALGVDAVLIGREVDESRFNFVLLRRQRVTGAFRVVAADGRDYWTAEHGAGSFGGLLLGSGQVITELRAQGDHGTSMASLALVDQMIAEAADTVPSRQPPAPPAEPASIAGAEVARTTLPDGKQRIVVTARGAPAQILTFDLLPGPTGIPMVPAAGDRGIYRGAHDVDAGRTFAGVRVHAHDAFGRTAQQEVMR